MAVDVTTDAVFPLETAPADATFCGSSFSFALAAATVLAAITDAAMATVTAAGSSSFSCFSAMDAETAADADLKASHRKKGLPEVLFRTGDSSGISCYSKNRDSGNFSPVPCLFVKLLLIPVWLLFRPPGTLCQISGSAFLFLLFFLSHTFQIQFVNGISIYDQSFIFPFHSHFLPFIFPPAIEYVKMQCPVIF